MRVIIVGCGKVGSSLAAMLSEESHDITLVDSSADRVNTLAEDLDVMAVVGNGASIDTLTTANVQEADILIAVTASDETNLLICLMAKKVGNVHTIARVRNPIYSREIDFIKAQMGVSSIINPEFAAANEIARLLHYPGAEKIGSFSSGRVHLVKIRVAEKMPLNGLMVRNLPEAVDSNILLCTVERDDDIMIPGGDFTLRAGDIISIAAPQKDMVHCFQKLSLPVKQVSDCIIVGGGTLAIYLAKKLIESKIPVTIIENNYSRCEELSQILPEAIIIHGDGTDRKLLQEERLEQASSFVAVTGIDEENIFISLYAQQVSNAKVITKVNHLAFDELVDSLGLQCLIQPKEMTADYILQYVRAKQNSAGNNVETLYRLLDNRVEALEFSIHENCSFLGVPLMNLNLKKNLLICCIVRGDEVIIPRGNDVIKIGDSVVVVTLEKGLRDFRDILKHA